MTDFRDSFLSSFAIIKKNRKTVKENKAEGQKWLLKETAQHLEEPPAQKKTELNENNKEHSGLIRGTVFTF